jgi:ATP-binding cassette subfamily B (MDR/TAP) protein 8
MYGALPPGAWWEVANGNIQTQQPYAEKAGMAAVEVGDLLYGGWGRAG